MRQRKIEIAVLGHSKVSWGLPRQVRPSVRPLLGTTWPACSQPAPASLPSSSRASGRWVSVGSWGPRELPRVGGWGALAAGTVAPPLVAGRGRVGSRSPACGAREATPLLCALFLFFSFRLFPRLSRPAPPSPPLTEAPSRPRLSTRRCGNTREPQLWRPPCFLGTTPFWLRSHRSSPGPERVHSVLHLRPSFPPQRPGECLRLRPPRGRQLLLAAGSRASPAPAARPLGEWSSFFPRPVLTHPPGH